MHWFLPKLLWRGALARAILAVSLIAWPLLSHADSWVLLDEGFDGDAAADTVSLSNGITIYMHPVVLINTRTGRISLDYLRRPYPIEGDDAYYRTAHVMDRLMTDAPALLRGVLGRPSTRLDDIYLSWRGFFAVVQAGLGPRLEERTVLVPMRVGPQPRTFRPADYVRLSQLVQSWPRTIAIAEPEAIIRLVGGSLYDRQSAGHQMGRLIVAYLGAETVLSAARRHAFQHPFQRGQPFWELLPQVFDQGASELSGDSLPALRLVVAQGARDMPSGGRGRAASSWSVPPPPPPLLMSTPPPPALPPLQPPAARRGTGLLTLLGIGRGGGSGR